MASVSPLEDEGDDLEEVGDDLLLPNGEVMGEIGERLEVQTEEGSIKKLLDPQLPTPEKGGTAYFNGAHTISKLVPDMREGDGEGYPTQER